MDYLGFGRDFRKKPTKNDWQFDQCRHCVLYVMKKKLCTKYNMISQPNQTCKSNKRKEK